MAVSGAACGGGESKDKPQPEQDAGIIEDAGTDCPAGYWGENCDNNTITCEHGTPRLGRDGDGKCSACEGSYFGENCDSNTITCVAGTPSIGITGNGKCASCNNPEQWTGENCDKEVKCVHGTLDTATGHCQANSCTAAWDGEDCDECIGYGEACTPYGTVTDLAGKNYKTVVIDGKTWMAENMAYQGTGATCLSGPVNPPSFTREDFIAQYGCLYTFDDAKKVCPVGWRLPTQEELNALLTLAGYEPTSSTSAFLKLIAKSPLWMNHPNEGTDDFSFSALPAGTSTSGQKVYAYFWSGTPVSEYAYHLVLDGFAHIKSAEKTSAFSVRCLKDDSIIVDVKCKHGTLDTATGHCQEGSCDPGFIGEDCDQCASPAMTGDNCDQCDPNKGFGPLCTPYGSVEKAGKTYKTVIIDGHEWMAENMAYQGVNDDVSCLANTAADANFIDHYGCLYTYADAQKACPENWRAPTKDEMNGLLTFAGTDSTKNPDPAFLALIANSTAWTKYSEQGTDDFGFGAMPAGSGDLDSVNEYRSFGQTTFFWSSTTGVAVLGVPGSYVLALGAVYAENQAVATVTAYSNKMLFSLRCINELNNIQCVHGIVDQTTGHCLAGSCAPAFTGEDCDQCKDGSTNCGEPTNGTMTDAAGKTYNTVKIGTQTWMAENMAYEGSEIDHCYYDSTVANFKDKYGCLYNYNDAMKVCPSGWHLPTISEVETLFANNNATTGYDYTNFWAQSEDWDYPDDEGKDIFGFAALPAGSYDVQNGSYENFGYTAEFWAQDDKGLSDGDPNRGGWWDIADELATGSAPKEDYAYSVRCLKGAAPTE